MNLSGFQLVLITAFVAYLFSQFYLNSFVWRSRQNQMLQIWKSSAEDLKLQISPGSFLPRASVRPLISGRYRGRQIAISPDTTGRKGYADAVLKISLSISNPSRESLPKGAFFVVGDPRKTNWLMRLFGRREDLSLLRPEQIAEFPWKAVPEALGGHLINTKAAQKILGSARIKDVLIDQGLLKYRQVGFFEAASDLRVLLNQLCDLADAFERYAKNWLESN